MYQMKLHDCISDLTVIVIQLQLEQKSRHCLIYIFTEDVVVAVSLSGMLNIWMLKPNVESKVVNNYKTYFDLLVSANIKSKV